MAKKDQLDNFMDRLGNGNRGFGEDLFDNRKKAPEADLTVEQKMKLHASRTANSGRKRNNARSTKHQVNFKVEQELWDEFQGMCLSEGVAFSDMIVRGMKRMIEEHSSK